MKLGPKSFKPAPKVDSIVMLFKTKEHSLALNQRELLLTFLRVSFKHRRKTLANNWCSIFSVDYIHEIFHTLALPVNIRAEDLDPKTWLTIFNMAFSYISSLNE
jgi:16S rRNA (adenine1518-N6/adenine1519-N6)-dimethyltransferase